MWVFTTSGFISAVFKDGALQVRARDAKSLAPLAQFAGVELIKSPIADYPYRLITDNETFSNWLADQAQGIDYSNFKSEISVTRGYQFAKPLNKVWSVMHEVEDAEARIR